MNVDSILKVKGREVATITAETKVNLAAAELKRRRIGALVVLNAASQVCGVMSERDVVTAVAEAGAGALEQPVNDFMTHEVVTCTRFDTIDQLMSQMTDRRIRHLPVVESGQLIGIISIGDVVKWRIAETEHEAEALKAYIATG